MWQHLNTTKTVPLAELWIASVEKSGFSDETRNLLLGNSDNINLPCLICCVLICWGKGAKMLLALLIPLAAAPSAQGESEHTKHQSLGTH